MAAQFHRPRKRFGQHFLHDRHTLQRIVDAIAPRPEDHLIEIGPGRGALTFLLMQRLPRLTAIEVDRDLARYLRDEAARRDGELQLINEDALKFDFSQLANEPRSLRVVGNLPYNISTPLIFHLIEAIDSLRDLHFLLQKEVVDRLAAQPGSKAYGRLSVMTQYHCHAERLFDVPPGAFQPPPKVDSAVVRLIPHQSPPVTAVEPAHFQALVQQAFSQRRKTLRKSLKQLATREDFQHAGIDSSQRPEQLAVQEFVELSNGIIARTKRHDYHRS